MNELSSNGASWFRNKLVERIQGHLWKKETLFVEASGIGVMAWGTFQKALDDSRE